MANPAKTKEDSASRQIDRVIAELGDWRGPTFSRLRELVKEADPEIVEELKWKRPANPTGSPVYSHNGIICTGAILKNSVRLTFFRGAFLNDPSGLFNFGLDSNTRRAIDLFEGEKINGSALKNLVRQAVEVNTKR